MFIRINVNTRKVLASFLFISFFFVISCNKKKEPENEDLSQIIQPVEETPIPAVIEETEPENQRKPVDLTLPLAAKPPKEIKGDSSYVELVKYFAPDYHFQEPDSILTKDNLKAADSTEITEQSENHIPGLRQLSDYITRYRPIYRTVAAKEKLSKKYLLDENAQQAITENNIKNYETLPLIYNVFGGFSENNDFSYSDETGAIPKYENLFYIKLNTPVSAEYLQENLKVTVDNNLKPFSLTPDYNHQFYSYWWPQNSDEKNQLSDSYIVKIEASIGINKIVYIQLKNPKESEYAEAIKEARQNNRNKDKIERIFQYKTLTKLKVLDFNPNIGSTKGKSKPIELTFSQIPDKSTIINNIRFDFDYTLTEDNFQLNRRKLLIYNLPIKYGENHSIEIGNGFKDIYGQRIAGSSYHRLFTIENEPASVQFLDSGFKMMEAKFPHKLVFSHRNILQRSGYKVSSITNPFNHKNIFDSYNKSLPDDIVTIEEPEANVTYYEEIDLAEYLNEDGYGFVKFEASADLNQYNSWSKKLEKRTVRNEMTVQVTDLGVTARIGINRGVLMVRSLSTGKPVANAEVSLYQTSLTEYFNQFNSENRFAYGKTNRNGVLVIDFNEAQVNAILHPRNADGVKIENARSNFLVKVQNGSDTAIFSPTTHNLWRDDINTDNIVNATKPKQKTFIFVDRGVYKPGETVSWRGIDKNLKLGKYEAAKGDYDIEIHGNWWKAPQIGETITGTLSSSGGFSGTFKIPDDAKPGYYLIRYSRADHKNRTFECSFQIANFERVKSQVVIDIPEMTYFGGDKINANVKAEYLAGGVLGNAAYTYNWYSQGGNFTSEEPESSDYSFGPYDSFSGRTFYSNEEGNLSSTGTVTAVCNSKQITDGKTYTYRIETAVTDVSNQRVSGAKSITVHPANFYIGMKRAQNVSGFAKKGTALEFPYILTDTSGKIINDNLSLTVKKLKYSLSHEEWSLVHEQSVDNTVYTRYSKTDVCDSEGVVGIDSKGVLTLTPKASGWYTLKLSGTDTKNNHAESSIRFYVTGNNTFFYNNYNSQGINLTTDKKEYLPGDTAQILMESPLPKGDYLITVEREGIFASEVRHIEKSTDVLEVPISKAFVPVVYVTVSSYSQRNGEPTHNFGEPDMDKPKQYFGATSVFVNPYTRAFNIEIKTDKAFYKPGDQATLTLKATKNGTPLSNAELTVMAVDRGVLDLVNYHVPNPIRYFYDAYNFEDYVIGGDSRAFLMDPVSYSIKDLQGGDSDEEKEDERKDFRPTALFEPVVMTDKNGFATVKFKMPDNLTTYRITAFGVKEDLFALQENETRVQNPVNVQAVQPRKLRVSDTAECGVLLTNLTKEIQKVTVSVEARTPNGDTYEDKAAGRKTIPGKAIIDGTKKCTVSVASGDSSVVYFDVAARNAGTVELVYTIESSSLKEKLVSPIKIENTYVYETQIVSAEATDEENKTSFIIPAAAKNSRGELAITLDATRLGTLNSSVNYLFDYPYDCLEQQASRVLPLVLFGKYIDAFDMNSKVSDVKKVVTTATQSWGQLQLPNGGFPYWSDGKQASYYTSLRIAHIYAVASTKAYKANELGIDYNKLGAYIAEETPKIQDNYLKAYACYVMRLNGDKRIDPVLYQFMARYNKIDISTAALVGISFAMDSSFASQDNAKKIAEHIRQYIKQNAKSVSLLESPYKDYWKWYNSDSGELASLLQLFTMVNSSDQINDKILYTLLLNQKKGYWKNTASTARVLDAISTYITYRGLDKTEFTGSASINGKEVLSNTFEDVGAKPVTLTLPFDGEFMRSLEKEKEYPVTFSKEGNGHLYYTVQMNYALPSERQIAVNNGIDMTVEITDFSTNKPVYPKDKTSVLELESGKTYKATITLASPVQLNYLALRAPIPSGCEILDPSFETSGSEAEIKSEDKFNFAYYNILSNKEIYDNEIHFFWDNFERGCSSVTFTFRAARRGVYSLPPVVAQCMYEEDINSRGDGWLCTIK